MCRIFGTFAVGASGDELAEVSARQRHGGPDGHGVCGGPGWSLGCDRLAVTDPAHGHQPYSLPTVPGVLAVFNGELYNHHRLRRAMSARGHHFPDTCDGGVLPALYAEHGADFPELLDGMFALAVLDLRGGRFPPRLLLAVDDAGMKSLYYHVAPDGALRFASELPALLGFDGVRALPRPDTLDRVLTTRTPLGEETALDGVRVLLPGTTAVQTGVRSARGLLPGTKDQGSRSAWPSLSAPHPLQPFHRPPHSTTPRPGRPDARETLRREVRQLGRADVPVCAVSSGGLDSALVTALAARDRRASGRPPLHTFHLTYRGRWPETEHGYARAVARRAGTVHHQVEADPAEFAALLPETVRRLGQPNADPIALSTHVLFRAIREEGFTVALTGDGADELFGGYPRVTSAVGAPEGTDWVTDYTEALSAAPRALREHLYTDAYRDALTERGRSGDALAARLRTTFQDRLTALTRFETETRMPAYHLRRVDHLSMAHAIEARLPFCQPSLRALAHRLPPRARLGKRALYAAGTGLLPPAVLHRRKQPFTLPLAPMLTRGSPLWKLARELLDPVRLREDGRLRAERVTALLERQADHPRTSTALAVWALLVHELWRETLPAAVRVPGRRAA
ncbi:asparagine synthase (glutamine-hydrolyzing) [Streptomyces sp. AJS327]|uniref:asparagine synthase (glutamine-hydrolyzing) n=1 Tax=Streptomyces sp. AJS327 TaxID=2545265 RepID=UPI0015E04FFE|nr:asparagine synthase (glutamine-hydrolyzing) [Streptomyces sp. AJS327]MBA0053167.1 asparagine synthase (glutamine-hydrolyzing) [Streptomyces sp. AJS327]